ncbi:MULTISPECIES: hypothetical protein [unclassified Nocardia]|uniref:hypothetical protein n=1 Tax=unclassified Nocardia TaxID=2637762 RepID=UPI003414691C
MTEVYAEDQEIFVPFSGENGEKPPEQDVTSSGRLYNNYPYPVSIVLHWDSRHIDLHVLPPGGTSREMSSSWNLNMKIISSDDKLIEWANGGIRYWYRIIARVQAGRTINVSDLFSSAISGDGAEQAGDARKAVGEGLN